MFERTVKVEFSLGDWHVCSDEIGVFGSHMPCPNTRVMGYNYYAQSCHRWALTCCMWCNIPVPDEIQALIILREPWLRRTNV